MNIFAKLGLTLTLAASAIAAHPAAAQIVFSTPTTITTADATLGLTGTVLDAQSFITAGGPNGGVAPLGPDTVVTLTGGATITFYGASLGADGTSSGTAASVTGSNAYGPFTGATPGYTGFHHRQREF